IHRIVGQQPDHPVVTLVCLGAVGAVDRVDVALPDQVAAHGQAVQLPRQAVGGAELEQVHRLVGFDPIAVLVVGFTVGIAADDVPARQHFAGHFGFDAARGGTGNGPVDFAPLGRLANVLRG